MTCRELMSWFAAEILMRIPAREAEPRAFAIQLTIAFAWHTDQEIFGDEAK